MSIVDGIGIRPDTGEILDDVPGDTVEWLTLQDVIAARNIDGWQQRRAVVKQALSRQLSQAGEKAIKTKYGTHNIRDGRETVDLAALRTLLETAEIVSPEQELRLYREAAILSTETLQPHLLPFLPRALFRPCYPQQ